ncbi:MAG: 3-dehydroquinate synthase II [Halalkalicoccus sp.]|nr:3-dehydroquinate synthase II [Halalkalicoccus sp.]
MARHFGEAVEERIIEK